MDKKRKRKRKIVKKVKIVPLETTSFVRLVVPPKRVLRDIRAGDVVPCPLGHV